MNDLELKQKIKSVYQEPKAPAALVQAVVQRAKAVTMGLQAQKQLETAAGENRGMLASQIVIGQLAAVSELPAELSPQQLANRLQKEPAFSRAMQGGNLQQRLRSGDFLRQLTEKTPERTGQGLAQAPRKQGPAI